jgi:alpha,alpha-trehalase
MRRTTRTTAYLLLLGIWLSLAPATVRVQARPQEPALSNILHYISSTWSALTRSMSSCQTFVDPKTHAPSLLYLPAGFRVPAAIAGLEKSCSLRVSHLPEPITRIGETDVHELQPGGLLYLPHPYVVPGGMFNEMYGWDSYFIIRGLLEEGKLNLARGIVENFFFEIDHYGGVLNANRGYFLTRSQPPFLTPMILAVYDAEKAQGRADRDWLAEGYSYAVKDYRLWTHAPHLAGDTGLSRYYDFGNGPVPELGAQTNDYYGGAIRYFLLHPREVESYLAREGENDLAGPVFSVLLCPPENGLPTRQGCRTVENVGLTKEFYKGDRALRESGFDISFRFGPYGAGTTHFAPVGLNSLLYKAETDLERISRELGRNKDAAEWHERALARARRVTQYLWNPQQGLFFDYNFKTAKQSSYDFATTFYPLWTGLATPEQARAVERNLKLFERPGGLATSTHETGAQWDYPYGWAPLQLIAVEGLRRYGYDEDANRLSREFLSTVLENFRRDGTIREKYNVVTRSSGTHIEVGYSTNVVGFGWTNGVFLALLHELPTGIANQLR